MKCWYFGEWALYGIKPVPTKPSVRRYWRPSVLKFVKFISLRLILVNTNIQNSTWNSCSSRSRIWTSEACCTVTEFTEGHQYRRTDGLVGTGLMPYKAHCLKYQHFMLFPYSSWCCCFTQILFLDHTHRELYYELYCITALFLHVWHYHVLQWRTVGATLAKDILPAAIHKT